VSLDILVVSQHGSVRRLPALADLDSGIGDGDLVWIDLAQPDADDFGAIAARYQLHPLAVEDAVRRRQRPKLETYDGHLFLVVYALSHVDDTIDTHEVSFFVGKGFVISVHAHDVPEIAEVRQRWLLPGHVVSHMSIGRLIHTLLDAIVDGYFPVLDAIGDRVDAIEERIFSGDGGSPGGQAEIFLARRNLVAIRKVLGPERDVLNALVRRDLPYFDDDATRYLEDVYDHILRVLDQADTYRDLTSNALDALLTRNANRLNEVMKRMTASSIILMSMALIAGVYGMNFTHIPELGWRLGYEYAISLMAVVGVALAAFFRKIDYF
jgi:magnesium transporter